MADNMRIYNAARTVPDGAKKPIKGGAYGAAGLTDINPQYRIERMTVLFGACGDGWKWEPVEFWEANGVCYAHVTVMYLMDDGEWSAPVHGYGGTKIGGKDDSDLYKSTITDAVGNALRYLGIGADVWYKSSNPPEKNQFDGKHSAPPEMGAEPPRQPATPPQSTPRQKRMAAPGQKEYIVQNASDELYQNAMTAYGAELENLTFSAAEKIIARIQGGENNAG